MKKKDTIQLVITGVLIIVLIRLAVGLRDGKRNSDSPVLPKKASNEQIIGEPIGAKKELYSRLEQETKNLKIRRSPFTEQIYILDSGPYLNGIFWDAKRPTAIINNKIVEHGSKVADYTVIYILRDRVILFDSTSREELRLELFE